MSSDSNKYVNFRTDGRMFPTWMVHNFSKYQLEEISQTVDGKDPCNKNKGDKKQVKLELRKYQKFVGDYLDFKSPYKNILLYHGLGSGKTATAINIYNVLYNYTPSWNVFILIKASLKGGWLTDLEKWLNSDEKEFRRANIQFINYDSPFADKNFMDVVNNSDSSKKSLYIIDEVHNFIRNVYTNMTSEKGKRAQNIYDHILEDKIVNPGTRVVTMSFTPVINHPFELALLFNLLRPGTFPINPNEFNNLYIKNIGYDIINPKKINQFQRRILGLVSYYIGSTPDLYASKTIEYVDVKMSAYQEDVYSFYEDIETKLAIKSRGQSQTYKSYTRQASNFVFPHISQRVNGELRPRPGKFRISEREASLLMEEGVINKTSGKVSHHMTQYMNVINLFIKEFKKYLDDANQKDISNNHTIFQDIDKFKTKYNGDFKKFNENEKNKSLLYDSMHKCSAKFVNLIFNIMVSKGPVLIYSNYVNMEGLQILKIYLKFIGFYDYMNLEYRNRYKSNKNKYGFVEFHGSIKFDARYAAMREFNKPTNKYGDEVKIIMISPAGSEGLNLRNVRQVHIVEPYWNEVRITQMIGRAIRACSHSDLPMNERNLVVFRYKSVRQNPELFKLTTDQYIEEHAKNKDVLIQSFLSIVKQSAVDCKLFYEHNKLDEEYPCFQFDEESLFDDVIGPAYSKTIRDDEYFDNGLNSEHSMRMRIKVLKIEAVKLLSEPGTDQKPKYSKSKTYWFHPKSRVVYDFKYKYPIGKVGISEDNIIMKLDEQTYVITKILPIKNVN